MQVLGEGKMLSCGGHKGACGLQYPTPMPTNWPKPKFRGEGGGGESREVYMGMRGRTGPLLDAFSSAFGALQPRKEHIHSWVLDRGCWRHCCQFFIATKEIQQPEETAELSQEEALRENARRRRICGELRRVATERDDGWYCGCGKKFNAEFTVDNNVLDHERGGRYQ